MALFKSNRQDDEFEPEEEEYDDGFDELDDGEAGEETDPEDGLERKRDRLRVAVGAGNLAAVIGGTVAILILLMLIINMIYFVINDMGRSFSLFQTNF